MVDRFKRFLADLGEWSLQHRLPRITRRAIAGRSTVNRLVPPCDPHVRTVHLRDVQPAKLSSTQTMRCGRRRRRCSRVPLPRLGRA